MGVIEGYANIVSNTEFTEEQKNYHLKWTSWKFTSFCSHGESC